MIEQAVGVLLGPPVLTSEGRGMRLELSARRRFSVSFGAARSSAEKGDPCGDSICSIDSGEDYFYAVICDGMGQGRGAAFASSASIGFLKQMLEAMAKNKKRYHYNYLGLFLAGAKIHYRRANTYYCSEFVKEMLVRNGIRSARALDDIIEPMQFLTLPDANHVYSGKLKDYASLFDNAISLKKTDI